MKSFAVMTALFLVFFLALPAFTADDADLEEQRRKTVQYGTDAEILKLVVVLENEKAEYLDGELAAVLEATKNGKIASTVFGYFARKKKPIAETRAIRTIQDRDLETNEAVEAAIDYLGKIGSREAPATLREILNAEEARFMTGAVRALGRTGGEAADENAAFLLAYFEERETNDSVKQAIVAALGELRSKTASDFLSELAANNDEKAVRRMAALDAIGMIGDPATLDAVIKSLDASDPNIRASAIAALGPFSGEKVDAAILEAFRDSFYKARAAAAKAAGERKMASAVQYLRYRAERDEVPAVREEAIRALGAIGSGEALTSVRSIFSEKKSPDKTRIVAASVLIEHDEGGSANEVVAALEEAKKEKRTGLYNGLLKTLSTAKSVALEDLARRLLASEDLTDKLYALDIARANSFRSLTKDIEKLAADKNLVLSRRAKEVLDAFGSAE